MELKELIGKQVTCEKVDSLRYKDGHPNGIDTGYITGGTLVQLEPFIFIETHFVPFYSSQVNKIEGDLVYTKNSVYKITELKIG